jgi:hypothetical protein
MKDFDSDDLSAKLRTWTVEPRVPDSFQRDVWQRISVRQTAREEAFWPQLAARVAAIFARPQYALALVIVSLSASIGVAHVQAQSTNVKFARMLEARYAASVDPLAMSR